MLNPADARPEQQIFDDLQKLTKQQGYAHVLAYFSWRDNFVSIGDEMTSKDLEASYAPSRLIRTEFNTLIGLMLNHPIDLTLPEPDVQAEYIERTSQLMEELHASFNRPMMEIFKPQNIVQTDSPFHQAEILREPIFYGGESAFNFQFSDLAAKRYSLDDNWLNDKLGFSSHELTKFERLITGFLNNKLVRHLQSLRKVHPEQWSLLDGFTFQLADLVDCHDFSVDKIASLLSVFSVKPNKEEFQFNSIGDFNVANPRPIIDLGDDEFLCLNSYSLAEAIYDSPFYWMQGDKSYRATASANRGAFTEHFVTDRLRSVFGDENVYSNVHLEGGRGKTLGEIDVFVRFGDRALVIQCKSKKLTLEARKGNDGQLKDDFKKAVQDSYDQALDCSEYIKNSAARLVLQDGSEIEPRTFSEIYPICITSESYPALSVQAREILKFKNGDGCIQPPLVTDVFLVDVMCEFLTSPLYFLSYVNRRVNYHDKLNVVSEFTVLSLHLKSNLWIDEDVHLLMLDESIALDLDTAFTVRRQGIGGKRVPDGILTRLRETYVGQLLAAIERSSEPALIDLGFALLKLSEDTFRFIEQGVRQISSQTLRDGRLHDLTMAFGKGEEGLTIHCSPDIAPSTPEKLRSHCEKRKYVSKASRWFGLSIRPSDGMPRFGVNLKGPWERDAALELATKGMNLTGNMQGVGRQLKRIKVGRNEQCPCGSGKKYKRCCLRNQR